MDLLVVSFFVPGAPKGKDRPRFTGKGRPHTSERTKGYEEEMRWAAEDAMERRPPAKGPICMTIIASFAPRDNNPWMIAKPDLDNIGKLVLDSLNKVVFEDDAQVCVLTMTKRYHVLEGVQITVEELPWPA